MVWTPADKSNRYGVVIYNYKNEEQHHLTLNIGDTVYILRQHGGWFYGFSTRDRRICGIFPRSYIHIKDVIHTFNGGYETITPKELPVVQEITTVLREWGALWRQTYLTLQKREGSVFKKIHGMMIDLINWRKQIMSSKLTVDELKELQQKVTNKIDMGNALLELDLVVRDDHGNMLDPANTSTISLFRQHELTTKRVADERDQVHSMIGPWKSSCFNLWVNVVNFVCHIGENADVQIAVYDAKQNEYISEHYITKWGNQGMPRDANIELPHNLNVLFTDLGYKDMTLDKVYLVCHIIRIGRMNVKLNEHKKHTNTCRRPFGVAVLDITDIMKGAVEPDETKQFFVPYMGCGEKDSMDSALRKAVSVKEITQKEHRGQGLWVSMKRIIGDIKQARKENAHLVTVMTAIARKMGFPDVIMPGDIRNDIYVTLAQGEFKKGNKTSDKNVEVTMTVCNEKGEELQNVVSEGAGGNMVTTYKSIIYYQCDRPKWFETVKVAVPIEDCYTSHLKFTFKHRSSTEAKDRSEKPFALAYVKLLQENGTTLSDRAHDLLVYKFDGKKSEDGALYMKCPSTRAELERKSTGGIPIHKMHIGHGPYSLNQSDSFEIHTLVCSTKLTHNEDLMGLLKWRENPSSLKNHLTAIMQVDGEDVVKFLQDILDALFNILMENSDCDNYDNLVFDALINLIGLISDRKYHQFRPVLDVYIEENFSATLAYNKLMVALKYYIENVTERVKSESLLKAMKSLEYIFKFIIKSRVLFAALNEGRGQQQFEQSLRQVFQTINKMMQAKSDHLVLIQGAALKYLPSTIGDVISAFSPKEFSMMLVEFVNNVPKNRLVKQKMLCVNDIVHSPLFLRPECREILLPEFMMHIKGLMEQKEEMETCVKILSDIMEALYKKEVGPTREDLSTIMLTMLRTVIQTVIGLDRDSPLTANYVAVMTAILRQMTEHHYIEYINHFATQFDLTDFLMEILMVFRDLVNTNVYPSDWNDMILLQNSVFLTALRHFSRIIKERFTSPFGYEVWNNFFHCAIAFMTQEALQLENFSTSKRNKIINKYKDMRREAGFEIRSMWFSLGQSKHKFIPHIIGPFLEMTLIPETELRKATIPIFFDMMQCEFLGQCGGRINGSFHQVESEIITQLDALVEGGRGDVQYKELFCDILAQFCANHKTMKEIGLEFVQTIGVQLERLLEYRDVLNDESKNNRMSCLVNLLDFYNEYNRKEMYIRYLQKLSDLHLGCDNFTEAAHTLMLYAKQLKWVSEALPAMLQSERHPGMQTHLELKEALYYDIISYFDKGKMWEKGIEMCKELAMIYDTETLDYEKMSQILVMQAHFYDNIMKMMRPEPEYFRVGYYGLGFPSFLQNKVFIYRGQEYERLSDFSARLQNQFPNAQLFKTLNPPGEDVLQSAKQYLQVNCVTPIMDLNNRFVGKNVHEQILKYYKVNEVQKFTFSRRIDESGSDVTNMWLERTNLTTSSSLPGLLRWFLVTNTHAFRVSPLEAAIETMESTNEKIKVRIEHAKVDPQQGIKQLGMVLNGIVDAAVQGGIANYKVFFSEEYQTRHHNQMDVQLVEQLKAVTVKQLELLDEGLALNRQGIPESMRPFQAHMEQRFSQMETFLQDECGVKIPETIRRHLTRAQSPVKRLQTVSSSSQMRMSEVPNSASSTMSPEGKASSSGGSRALSVLVKSSPSDAITGQAHKGPVVYRKDSSDSRSLRSIFTTPSRSSIISSDGSDISESNSSKRSNSVIIELNEQLTAARPLRPEGRRSRPPSAHFSQYLQSDSSSTASTVDNDEPPPKPSVPVISPESPPPLPLKTSTENTPNSTESTGRLGRISKLLRRGSSENVNSLPLSLPPDTSGGSSPKLPPKKPGKKKNESDV